VAVASCGGSTKKAGSTTTTAYKPSPQAETPPNACPPDGCRVRIGAVARDGDELKITFVANYTPDMSRNHFHVYWDRFTSRQVSDDAQQRFGVAQGDWVPTDQNPYTTGDAVSTKVRGSSRRVCVTAGDRDHNVIDPDLFDCRDVSNLF
jgi:hypothetical protein